MTPRKKVELLTLPTWLQYLIAISTTAIVVAIAWVVAGSTPTPATTWTEHTLAPILGWLFIILVLGLIIGHFIKGRK